MKVRRPFLPGGVLPWVVFASVLLACSLVTASDLDLGRVDKYRLESYARYFGRYLSEPDVQFEDPAFKEQLTREASEIRDWLLEDSSWPPLTKITPAMQADAGRLFLYFSRLGLEGMRMKAAGFFKKALDQDPNNYLHAMDLARLLGEQGGPGTLEAARYAERALELAEKEAAAENMYYLAGTKYYESGFFVKALRFLRKQREVNPGYENTSDLCFVLEAYEKEWGRSPERVRFEAGPSGVKRPVPVDEKALEDKGTGS